MDGVNQTLYIPLYGKAFVSNKNIILKDEKAEEIWKKEGFPLKGKSKSKWLAYYMAMRAAVYDAWVAKQLRSVPGAVVLHIGCGMDSRILRVAPEGTQWYDMDFAEVIAERRKYYAETDFYHMISVDMREEAWKKEIEAGCDAIVIIEGVSMYFKPEELTDMLSGLAGHFKSVRILMDCYTKKAARVSKYRNPINDVGVTLVYGYDNPQELAEAAGLTFIKEGDMTPEQYVNELHGLEKSIYKTLCAGAIARSLYRMYEFAKE